MAASIKHDPEADAVYITLRDAPRTHSKELDSDRVIDYAKNGQPRGVELLNVSMGVDLDGVPERDEIAWLLNTHRIKVFA